MNASFSKSSRILTKRVFQDLRYKKKRYFGQWVIIDYRLGIGSCPKLGITVSRRFGKAHVRNRFKRLVREAFRLNKHQLVAPLEGSTQMPIEMIVFGKKDYNTPSFSAVTADLLNFMQFVRQKETLFK